MMTTFPKMFATFSLAVVVLTLLLGVPLSSAFVSPAVDHQFRSISTTRTKHVPSSESTPSRPSSSSSSSTTPPPITPLFSQSPRSSGDEEFSREVRLRAEAESPFVKVRYFFYLNAAGGAFTSLAISLARIAAATAGVNTDLMDESLRNAAIDIAGLAVISVLYRRDQEAEQSRLKRASKGAGIAKLTIRASKALLLLSDVEDDGTTFSTTLASLRRGRGIEKRVVIAAAGSEKLKQVLQEAENLRAEMDANDLVIVPVVMPRGVAPDLSPDTPLAPCVALPVTVAGTSWKAFVEDEAAEAIKQGVDVEEDGICIILKKNGRVGQRTKGIFLNNLVGNVVARREAGMDVTNI